MAIALIPVLKTHDKQWEWRKWKYLCVIQVEDLTANWAQGQRQNKGTTKVNQVFLAGGRNVVERVDRNDLDR